MIALVSTHPDISTSIETKNRKEFIKVCHILASGLDVGSRRSTTIILRGKFDIGKSLIADSIISALNDDLKMKHRYAVPEGNKMMLEAQPAQALQHAVKGRVKHNGRDVRIIFARSPYDIPSQGENDAPRLVFLAHNDSSISHKIDLVIRLDKQFDFKNMNDPARQWDVTITGHQLFNDRMMEKIRHLKQVTARRMHQKTFKF